MSISAKGSGGSKARSSAMLTGQVSHRFGRSYRHSPAVCRASQYRFARRRFWSACSQIRVKRSPASLS